MLVVLHPRQRLDLPLKMVRDLEAFQRLVPSLPVQMEVPQLDIRALEFFLLPAGFLHNSLPIPQLLPHLYHEILSLDLFIHFVGLVGLPEKQQRFRALFLPVVENLKALNQLQPLEVLVFQKRFFRGHKIPLVEGFLREQFPQHLVRAALHEGEGLLDALLLNHVLHLLEQLGLELDDDLGAFHVALGLDDLVEHGAGHLEVREAADEGLGGHRLVGLDAFDRVEPGALHEAEVERVVLGPHHVPAVLFLELEQVPALVVHLQDVQGPVQVDDAEARRRGVHADEIWPGFEEEFGLERDLWQGEFLDRAAETRDEKEVLRGRDGLDYVLGLLLLVEGVLVVHLGEVGLFVDEPGGFSADFPHADLGVKGGGLLGWFARRW